MSKKDCNVASADLVGEDFYTAFDWIVEIPDNVPVLEFETEDEACHFQRLWRLGAGLNPETGEAL